MGITLCIAATSFSYGQRPTPADFDFLGVEHNKLLDYVYNEIKNNRADLRNLPLFGNSLSAYYTSAYSSYPDVRVGAMAIQKTFASKPQDPGTSLYTPENGAKMSDEMRNYLDELSSIIFNNTNGFAIKSLTTALEVRINNDQKLNNTELGILFSTTSIAKYSADYWATNINNWKSLPGAHPGILGMNRYIGADVIAGGTVAAEAWWLNGWPGVGTAWYGGSIIGTAFGASAFTIIVDLL